MALNIFKKKRRPVASVLARDVYKCEYCGEELKLSDLEPFHYSICPTCDKLFFVPYRVSSYWLYQPLGGGGMGSVYKAIHAEDPNLDLAVKVLPRDVKNDPLARERLIEEGRVGKLFGEHPHLTAVLDFGVSGDEAFVAMEALAGNRLDILIAGRSMISQRFILAWAEQLLAAEQHMYDRGYLYRDLKPQNIIINYSGKARLYDYGLCLPLAEAAKAKGGKVTMGSPQYVPPERLAGEGEGMPSEIYSLGMIMFHALSGETYYSQDSGYDGGHAAYVDPERLMGDETKALLVASEHALEQRIGLPRKLPANIDPGIAGLIAKMVERSPAKRFQTFQEAAAAISSLYGNLYK